METNNQTLKQSDNSELDLAKLIIQVWAGRRIILISMALFLAIGIFYLIYPSFLGIKEYEAQATLFVESPSPDSLITVTRSPLFISEVLKIKLAGIIPGDARTVAEILDKQTIPPQGNLASLTNRIIATKGDAGIVMITVKMQDQSTATQLTDSVTKKLTQFLKETQQKRVVKNQQLLAMDTSKTFQDITEASLRNMQYQSKGAINNIKFLTEGTSKDIRYLSRETSKNIQFLNKGSEKEIEFQKEGAAKNIQFQEDISAKNIQFLSEGLIKAESIYIQSQKELDHFYKMNSSNVGAIDSIEVNRLNSDIRLKHDVYSGLYQQLQQAKIEGNKQAEMVKIDEDKQLERVKINADKQLEQAKLDSVKQLEQAKLNLDKQLEQAKLDADKQLEQTKIEADKQIQQAKADAENQMKKLEMQDVKSVPLINVLEPATLIVRMNRLKTVKVILFMFFFGLLNGVGIVFGKNFWDKNLKKN